jgi:ribokinase
MVNSHDPHRPFFVPGQKLWRGMAEPSRTYIPEEVVVPGFLPDLPDVRKEVSYYYNSVKRLDDAFGKKAVENYRNDGIDTSCIKVLPGTHSGIALINVAADGENSIPVAPGPNSYLFPEDVHSFEDSFDHAKVVLAQLEIPMETVAAAAETAHAKGIPFILNPAPGAAIPESLLSKVTIISPNETEAVIITSRKNFSEKDIPKMAGEISEKGGTTVLLTLGSKGVYLKSPDIEGMIPGHRVKAVDTTAAGDVFNGALAAAFAGGMELNEAVDFAQRAAAISVTRMGAQPSAPTLDEIKQF